MTTNFDIRIVALDESSAQRVRLAASLLGAYRAQARVSEWDGTRCHLLIAAGRDAYAQRAIELATRRGTPVICFGEPLTEAPDGAVSVLPGNATAAMLARDIRARLILPSGGTGGVVVDGVSADSAIVRLAAPSLQGATMEILSHGRAALLRPDVGRVYAATHSDLLRIADDLAGGAWELRAPESSAADDKEVSASVESFLVRAAFHAAATLPPFPDGTYRLKVWPDLGSLPSLVSALQMAKALTTGSVSAQGRDRNGREVVADEREFNAGLWAFAAAGLLVDAQGADIMPARHAASADTKRRLKPGLWNSLARKFGLIR